jgi:hypothetical protein
MLECYQFTALDRPIIVPHGRPRQHQRAAPQSPNFLDTLPPVFP